MPYLDFDQIENVEAEVNTSMPLADIVPSDDDWVKNAFMEDPLNLNTSDVYTSIYDVDTFKFTDTSMGGSISLNVYPQFTRYADVRMPSQLLDRTEVTVTSTTGNYGMGHYYSEAIDDNSINVYFEFGVPEFNNILFYFLSATDYKTAVIANEGRSPMLYNAGEIMGTVALVMAFPYITIPALIIKEVFQFLGNMGVFPGRFDYYYVKPTMFNYWASVNSLVTMMASELGLILPIFKDSSGGDKVGLPLELDQDSLDAMKDLLPGIVTSGNVINVHGMVGRAQKRLIEIRRKQLEKMKSLSEAGTIDPTGDKSSLLNELKITDDNVDDLWEKLKDKVKNDPDYKAGKDKKDALIDYLKKAGGGEGNNTNASDLTKLFEDSNTKYKRDLREKDKKSYFTKALDTFKTVFNEGARYAVFRVEHVGSITESFSNTTTTVDTVDTVNEMGKTWRKIKFNLDGGNIPGLDTVLHALTDFAGGALSGITMGFSNVVASFLSGMHLDAPMRWDDSTFNLPSLNFKMKLVSPSAHPIAQLRGIYIPLAAILAAALPRSTGPRSYTSPFVCSMFVRGYQRVTLGMITSLSITRGTSNLPFNKYMRPLAVDVDFTVTDFSQVLASPTPSSLLSPGDVAFDDESGISRYISALCGRDLFSATHVSSKFKIKLSTFLKSYLIAASPETVGAMIGDALGSNFLFSMFSGNTKQAAYGDAVGNDVELNKLIMGE